MRALLLHVVALLAVLATSVLAWDKEDHEIFDLVTAVEASEGAGTSFYSWLDVPPSAPTAEIARAYRKLSMQLHPDKNPGVQGVQERFARLGVVATILRNDEGRKRYDFFYKNGVPKWRGTGYYYSRFRPGLGSVLVFLTLLTSALQLLVQRLNHTRDLQRITRLTHAARAAAWGPKLVPLEGQRKVKVNLGGQYDEDGASTGGGRTVDMVVEGQSVYILDSATGTRHPLDPSAVPVPALRDTWFLALVRSLMHKARGALDKGAGEDRHGDRNGDAGADVDAAEASGSATPPAGAGEENGRVPPYVRTGKRKRATRKWRGGQASIN